ncbi:MAG: polymorphic toxin type 10 domain-containing protein, partial [Thermoleophilia bacterium]
SSWSERGMALGFIALNFTGPGKGLKGLKLADEAADGLKYLDEAGAVGWGISNPVPTRLARVIPGNKTRTTLGRPGSDDVFVTAADDIAGMNAEEISKRLTIAKSDTYTVIEFQTPSRGLASPINRSNPGFVGHGRTAGGAREFVIPNQTVPDDATVRIAR